MDTEGNQFIPWEEINSADVVITPAFGTTLEIEKLLEDKGIELQKYDTTCPFVQKVWNRSEKLGSDGFTIVIHGKHKHEETRATFSHSQKHSPSIVVLDLQEAKELGKYISGEKDKSLFEKEFQGKFSEGFDPERHLERVGVVNQTTMLATETQEIADYLKGIMQKKHGVESKASFADTRDTLCYATNDNQQSTLGALEETADLAIVVGGYNSSNTSHIVELCEKVVPSYFIKGVEEIVSQTELRHFDIHQHEQVTSYNYLPESRPLRIILTSGASCPDAVVESVMQKLLSFFPNAIDPKDAMAAMEGMA
jgi:4-hydroxy-3-methylbut-2-enyl diphosphate reductase